MVSRDLTIGGAVEASAVVWPEYGFVLGATEQIAMRPHGLCPVCRTRHAEYAEFGLFQGCATRCLGGVAQSALQELVNPGFIKLILKDGRGPSLK